MSTRKGLIACRKKVTYQKWLILKMKKVERKFENFRQKTRGLAYFSMPFFRSV